MRVKIMRKVNVNVMTFVGLTQKTIFYDSQYHKYIHKWN